MRVEWLGRIAHAEAVARMETARREVRARGRGAEVLLLAEHDPVITLGRGATAAHVVAPAAELERRGVTVVRSDRGGDVTYHGPGQLMVYPVARVRRVVGFLRAVAGALAATAAEFGVAGAAWRRDPAGLWLDDAKLAACGIHLSGGVAIHGFALNVATPADCWRLIVPCGLAGAAVTSLAAARGDDGPPIEAVAEVAGRQVRAALST